MSKLSFKRRALKLPTRETPPRRIPPKFAPLVGLTLLGFFMVMMIPPKSVQRRIRPVVCRHDRRETRCDPKEHGTFIADLNGCDSVYEIGGIPFSSAGEGNVFKAPSSGKPIIIKDVDSTCTLRGYLDNTAITMQIPFTFVTTSKHTKFIIKVDGITVADAPSSLFDAKTRGPWIAYTFDVPYGDVIVTGDADDVIHLYGKTLPT